MNWKDSVYHNPSGIYLEGLSQGIGSPVTLRVRCGRKAPIKKVYLRIAPDGEQQMLPARLLGPIPGWDCRWWEVTLLLSNPRLPYRFFLLTEEGGFWLTAMGLVRFVPTDHTDFQILSDQYHTSWLDHAVFYQIFPDRFCDGDPSNNVRSGEYLLDGQPVVARKWGQKPNVKQGGREFFGGDLQGIERQLDYLAGELGINALYLNPIGTAPSSHKYDVASYTEVDPHFGGDQAFFSLKRAMEERGVRLILDIVPNHCGVEHPWFQAALRDRRAETAEFFTFRGEDDYDCWLGIRSLPKLNYSSLKLREWMYAGPDAIMRRWLRPPYNIDGWRLDVANMLARHGAIQLGHKVMRGMRRAVKAEKPDCYFLGENFFDASSYLQGDQLDATMNYRGFMMPLMHWLSGQDYNAVFQRQWADRHPLSTLDLDTQWRCWRATVPWAMARAQLNLLDSHDTPRLLNLVNHRRDLAAVARLILFTYPGLPCVYYGDEIALEGGRDPHNRATMEWDRSRWPMDWWSDWQRLVQLRVRSEALARGSMQTLLTEGDTLAFVRETREQRTLVVARRAGSDSLAVPVKPAAIPERARFREFWTGQVARVTQGNLPVLGTATQIWEQI